MTPEQFKKLQKKWYRKLKAEGFVDIEHTDKVDMPLKRKQSSMNNTLWDRDEIAESWDSSEDRAFTRGKGSNSFFRVGLDNDNKTSSKELYYQMASDFLHNHKFLTSNDLFVWDKHSKGATVRDIASDLRLSKSDVDRVIQRLRKEMLHGS